MSSSAKYRVSSIQTFLEEAWHLKSPPNTAIVLYRGQPDDRPLLPKLFRNPDVVSEVAMSEPEMLARLKETSPHLAPSRPDNDWDWLSLGQHYGMSTRMSDWSANPLIALFFAVQVDFPGASPQVFQYPIESEYIQHDRREVPFRIQHTRVFQPFHSHRSDAQAAWHIVHAIHVEAGVSKFIPLGDMPPHHKLIRKIAIPETQVANIRKELSQMGINHSTVYGDFGSVCRSIAPAFGFI